MQFLCPNCGSNNYKSVNSIGKRFSEPPYSNVTSEIQCSKCFMDIPNNLCENINTENIYKVKKLWLDDYKPFHINHAAKCSKCYRTYWEIEKYLFDNKIESVDIFYQSYNPQKGAGSLVCKICDPTAFK